MGKKTTKVIPANFGSVSTFHFTRLKKVSQNRFKLTYDFRRKQIGVKPIEMDAKED